MFLVRYFRLTVHRRFYQTDTLIAQEERDHHFGRLFGAETVIKSAILFHDSNGFQSWSEVLDLILGLAKKRLWLREECGWILYRAVQKFGEGGHDSKYVQQIIAKLQDNGLTITPEGIAIWIVTSLEFPLVKLPQGIWLDQNPMHRQEKAKLATILKESSFASLDSEGDSNDLQNGIWNSKLHFAWDVVLGRVLGMQSLESSKDLDLFSFWDECVDSRYNPGISVRSCSYIFRKSFF